MHLMTEKKREWQYESKSKSKSSKNYMASATASPDWPQIHNYLPKTLAREWHIKVRSAQNKNASVHH